MSVINFLDVSCSSLGHVSMNNEISAHNKDGRQMLSIAVLVHERLELLESQLTSIAPDLDLYGFSLIPLGLGLVSAFASPFAKSYLKYPNEKQNYFLTVVSQLVIKVGNSGEFLCKHANKMMNGACCVSYVAMIAFGHPISGGLGLVGLFIIAIKQKGYLPPYLDRALEPIAFFASVVSQFMMPATLLTRLLQIYSHLNMGTDLAKRFNFTRQFLPKSILYPLPGVFKVEESKQPEKLSNFRETVKNNKNFEVNFSSIYTEELNDVLPNDAAKDIDMADPKELFDELEKRLDSCQFEDLKLVKKGLEKLKKGVIEGKVEDVPPPNFSVFQRMMKALVRSILDYPVDFEQSIHDLADIGNSCTEGWTRDVTFMLHPASKKASWLVHQKLAILRGEMIQEKIFKMNQDLKKQVNQQPHVAPALEKLEDELAKSSIQKLKQILNIELTATKISGLIEETEEIDNPEVVSYRGKMIDLADKIEELKKSVGGVDLKVQDSTEIKGIDLDLFGGPTDVHVRNAAECALWNRFRPYNAELYHQIYSRDLTETLWILMMNKDKSRDFTLSDKAFVASEISHINESLMLFTFYFIQYFEKLDKEYSVELLVDSIYDAIKPHYEVLENNEAWNLASIPWAAIQQWQGEIGHRIIALNNFLDEGDNWDPQWIETDNLKQKNLTKDGVRLLLWDMGILKPKKKATDIRGMS